MQIFRHDSGSNSLYPVRGEYVTAKIRVKDALLQSPDLNTELP